MTTPWETFRSEVRAAEAALGNPDPIWYRGQNEAATYKLVPSLFRHEDGVAKEELLFDLFVKLGGRGFVQHVFKESEPLDEAWSTLFDMQHYDVPTRLLDWTYTLGVSVAFALWSRKQTEEGAAVFLLDPIALNKKSRKGLIEIRKDGPYKYKELYLKGEPVYPDKPLAIEPPRQYLNDRMAAQHSVFTVHTSDHPLEDEFPDVVKKILLPSEAREGAEQFLKDAGITAVTIFPDPQGVAREIRTRYLGPTRNAK